MGICWRCALSTRSRRLPNSRKGSSGAPARQRCPASSVPAGTRSGSPAPFGVRSHQSLFGDRRPPRPLHAAGLDACGQRDRDGHGCQINSWRPSLDCVRVAIESMRSRAAARRINLPRSFPTRMLLSTDPDFLLPLVPAGVFRLKLRRCRVPGVNYLERALPERREALQALSTAGRRGRVIRTRRRPAVGNA